MSVIKSLISPYVNVVPKFRLSLDVKRYMSNKIDEDFLPKKKKAKSAAASKKVDKKKASQKRKEELEKKDVLDRKKNLAISRLMTRNLTFSQYGPPLQLNNDVKDVLNTNTGRRDDSGGYWLTQVYHQSSEAKRQKKEDIKQVTDDIKPEIEATEADSDGIVMIVDDTDFDSIIKEKPLDNAIKNDEHQIKLNPFLRSDINETLTNQDHKILKIGLTKTIRSKYPSVSKILNVSMSDENRKVLLDWEARMKLELGQQGFEEYKQNTFKRGHAIHSWIENSLLQRSAWQDIDLSGDEVTLRHIESVSHVIDKMTDVRALESAVFHPQLQYCGIVDCIGRLNDDLCLIDWKTSEKLKPDLKSLYDNPLQLVAYIGAINADPAYKSLGSIDKGAVIVIYNSGFSANIHRIPVKKLQKFWSEWLKRLNIYKHKTNFPEIANSGFRL